MNDVNKVGLEIIVHGLVQGVYFRAFTQEAAITLNITGQVCNLPDGTVKIVACGYEKDIKKFIEKINIGSKQSRVEKT